MAQRYVAVVGPGHGATARDCADAAEVGRLLALAGAVVLTGGGAGVMDAAAAGATGAGGLAVGVLPGADRSGAHGSSTVVLPTGLGELRNGLLVRAAHAVVAVGGSWGTLSEVALAVRTGVPVVALHGWAFPEPGPRPAADPAAAAALALRLAEGRA